MKRIFYNRYSRSVVCMLTFFWFMMFIVSTLNLFYRNPVSHDMIQSGPILDINPCIRQSFSIQHNNNTSDDLKIKEKQQHRKNHIENKQNGINKRVMPSLQQIHSDIDDLWMYIKSQTGISVKKSNESNVEDIISEVKERKFIILAHLNMISSEQRAKSWRNETFNRLSNIVQQRLYKLQNPQNCSAAKKIMCDMEKNCGFGCLIHHFVYCFIVAYATNRTFILDSRFWKYSGTKGWNEYFEPLSNTCTSIRTNNVQLWGEENENKQVIKMPFIHQLTNSMSTLPPAIPDDLADDLMILYAHPFKWWAGQFVRYLLRPNEETMQIIVNVSRSINFSHPIVGVHVRRGDKLSKEACKHKIEQYMGHVEDYYTQLETDELSVKKKQVYLASDDPKLFVETAEKYPDYNIIRRPIAIATNVTNKPLYYKEFISLFLDLYFLSHSDFLVATFSSNFGRLSHELMQSIRFDAEMDYRSLDDNYYFLEGNPQFHVAIYNHKSRSRKEISFKKGDMIAVAGNHWNGYSLGKVNNSGIEGYFPSYKVKYHVKAAHFPVL